MKKQKIPDKVLAKWDKKSTFGVITIACLFVALYLITYGIPQYLRNRLVDKYQGMTTAIVSSVKTNTTETQGFDGAKTVPTSYTISFYYHVHGKTYGNTNNVPCNLKYRQFVQGIYKSNFKKEIRIRYNLKSPEESLILFE